MSLANRKSIEPWIRDDIKFYQHQVDGVRRAATMQSFLLADEMGLGKSLQALTVYGIDLAMKRSQTMIVVCPTTLKKNWAKEIEKFMGVVKYMILSNKNIERRERELAKFGAVTGPKVLIMNYEQVRPHVDTINSLLFDIVVFDEAHMLKNPAAARTKACMQINATRRFMLTGSPIMNQVNDLWVLLHMIQPKEFGSYHWFVNNYCVFGGYKDKQVIGVKNELELNAKLNTVMIRRLKKDVLDLPEVQYTTRMVGLSPKQQKLYDEVIEELQLTYDEDDEEEVEEIDNPLHRFTRLKQICGTTATVLTSKEDYSEKLDAAVWDARELVKMGERVVAFTGFRPVQEAYVNRLVREFNNVKNRRVNGAFAKMRDPFPVFVLNGDTPADERQEIVDQWSNSELPGVIVCTYHVAGVGLNMTAGRYGQKLDKLFNPPLNQQAVDRMHRIGADKSQPVQILEYRCKDTVEDRVEEILRNKKKITDAIVESDPLLKKAITQALKEEKQRLGK
ncbi:helicase [Gordonia phage Camerico]|nr:helicase [Gordonia phage Camerico]